MFVISGIKFWGNFVCKKKLIDRNIKTDHLLLDVSYPKHFIVVAHKFIFEKGALMENLVLAFTNSL